MLFVLIVGLLTCAAMIGLVFFKPAVTVRGEQINIYWLPPVAGALILILSGTLSWGEVAAGLTAPTAMNPIKILILFFSMTLISVFLDSIGFFRYLAERLLGQAKGNQNSLFLTLYVTVSVLTVFTSNDIIVLTFTPFICYFARHAKIDPIPYLFCEFIAANTWSMLLIIGNPTNIYLATGAGVDFFSYIKVMALPTLLAGGVSLGVLMLIFRKKLRQPMELKSHPTRLRNRTLTAIGVGHLGVCILFLVFSSVLDLPMWLIALVAMLSLFISATVCIVLRRQSLVVIKETLKRTPLEMAPFILSMFVLVLALNKVGLTARIADLLAAAPQEWGYGATSFFSANLMNNIPMSVLFSGVTANIADAAPALYAAVIGSNLGAFFTPIGALAGIMWMQLLRTHKVSLSFGKFTQYGAAVALPTLLAALLGLQIML